MATPSTHELTVYTNSGCTQCTATTRWLDKRHIAYRLEPAQSIAAEARARGMTQAPIVVAGTTWWSGFRPDLLGLHSNAAA